MAKKLRDYVKKVRMLEGLYLGKKARDMVDIWTTINTNAEILASMIELYEAEQKRKSEILKAINEKTYYEMTKEAAERM